MTVFMGQHVVTSSAGRIMFDLDEIQIRNVDLHALEVQSGHDCKHI